ncbi:MAG: BON domain-containing protein [Fibrobacterota bacterium]|nr:BON domain-containing protein [Fibrobacterota bacterium]
MERFLIFLVGAGFGAAAGHWFNREPLHPGLLSHQRIPSQGEESALDIVHRTQFLLREIRALVAHAEIPDPVLKAKIQVKIARMLARPDAVQVSVVKGKVFLWGTAREEEVRRFSESVSSIRGVKSVENRLETLTPPFTSWDDAEPGSRSLRWKPGSYSPVLSLIMAASGVTMTVMGFRLRGEGSAVMVAGGATLLGAGAAGLISRGSFKRGTVSHISESSSWRPGLKGSQSTASP